MKETGYSLVLLDVGDEVSRIVRATMRVRRCDADEAIAVLRAPLPIRISAGLTPDAAREGQWEFVSCDCIAIFVRDEIIDEGGADYLRGLFDAVRRSPEFAQVRIEIESVPESVQTERFIDQFLGAAWREFPLRVEVREKKARLMEAFAGEIGIVVRRM